MNPGATTRATTLWLSSRDPTTRIPGRSPPKMCTKIEWNYWITARSTSLRSSRRTLTDEIINFFMNSSHNKFWNFVKLKSQRNGRNKEVWEFHLRHCCKTKISRGSETLSLNSQARFRNDRMKSIVWMTREIFKMLNQHAVEIPTLPVDQCHSHLIRYLKGCWGILSLRRAPEKGRQAFGTHMVYRETSLQIHLHLHQHLILKNCINGIRQSRSRSIHLQWRKVKDQDKIEIWDASLDSQTLQRIMVQTNNDCRFWIFTLTSSLHQQPLLVAR